MKCPRCNAHKLAENRSPDGSVTYACIGCCVEWPSLEDAEREVAGRPPAGGRDSSAFRERMRSVRDEADGALARLDGARQACQALRDIADETDRMGGAIAQGKKGGDLGEALGRGIGNIGDLARQGLGGILDMLGKGEGE